MDLGEGVTIGMSIIIPVLSRFGTMKFWRPFPPSVLCPWHFEDYDAKVAECTGLKSEWEKQREACNTQQARRSKIRLGLPLNRAPQKIHFAQLKHVVLHQNEGMPPFTRQCSGV